MMDEDENVSVKYKSANTDQLESITKKILLKSRGKVFGVVRENYLRTDIPCRSQVCFDSCPHKTEQPSKPQLPEDVTHYIIPCIDVASKFMDIFELEEMSGVIFPQTVVNAIQQNSLKHYRRICTFIREPKNASIFFMLGLRSSVLPDILRRFPPPILATRCVSLRRLSGILAVQLSSLCSASPPLS